MGAACWKSASNAKESGIHTTPYHYESPKNSPRSSPRNLQKMVYNHFQYVTEQECKDTFQEWIDRKSAEYLIFTFATERLSSNASLYDIFRWCDQLFLHMIRLYDRDCKSHLSLFISTETQIKAYNDACHYFRYYDCFSNFLLMYAFLQRYLPQPVACYSSTEELCFLEKKRIRCHSLIDLSINSRQQANLFHHCIKLIEKTDPSKFTASKK